MTTRAAHAETVANARAKVFDSFADGELTMAQFNADIDALIAAVRHEAGADRLHPHEDGVSPLPRQAQEVHQQLEDAKDDLHDAINAYAMWYGSNNYTGSVGDARRSDIRNSIDLLIAAVRADALLLLSDHPHEDGADTAQPAAQGPRQAQEVQRLQLRITWLEGTVLPHVRSQEHANGFQAGWHSVIDRLREGDTLDELQALVPDSRSHARADALPQSTPPEDEQTDQARSGVDGTEPRQNKEHAGRK